jgi:hypothetical protein
MAKKARKKTARRKAARKTATKRTAAKSSTRGSSLRRVSTSDLQSELQRRSRDLVKLEAKRDAFLAEAETISAEISVINAALGAASGGTVSRGRAARKAPAAGRARRTAAGGIRKRPRNAASLEVSLSKVLQGKTMGVTEVANAVQKAGYKTTSPNFRTIVNQTLIRSALIKKIGRGAYTAK